MNNPIPFTRPAPKHKNGDEAVSCKACGTHGFTLIKKTFADGSTHVAAVCGQCDTQVQYIKQQDTTELPEDMVVPFGKHKGRTMQDLIKSEPGYVAWMAENIKDGLLKSLAIKLITAKKSL